MLFKKNCAKKASIFDVWQFQTVIVLFVLNFQQDSEEERQDTERREDNHRHGVAASGLKHVTYDFRHEAQADVLHPEDEAVSRAEHFLVDNLWHAWPQGCRHEREANAKNGNQGYCKPFVRHERQEECEAEVASNHDDCTCKKHRSAFAHLVDECAKERGENHCQNWEETEKLCACGSINLQSGFKEVWSITLEREDGAVIEHAEQCHNPVHLAAENLLEVGILEFVFAAFFGEFTGSDELLVEFLVHQREHDEVNQTNKEQCCTESNWGSNGVAD